MKPKRAEPLRAAIAIAIIAILGAFFAARWTKSPPAVE
jgi:hypothetical protein